MTTLAILGASERRIPWTSMLLTSLARYDFRGETWLINPKREHVLGRRCYPSLTSLPGTPDVAFVLLAADRAIEVCRELAVAGCRDVVVVSNGFGETQTEAGARRQEALGQAVEGTATRLYGPNCVGFASFYDGLCALAQPVPGGIVPGPVSIVSQSGGLTGAALGAVMQQGLGMDVCYSIGNGVSIGLAAALRSALSRRTTQIVCAVVEAVDDADEIESLVHEAHGRGQHIVVLVLGQSEGSRSVAASHTGAVVGEYEMVVAWLQGLGVTVVASAQELGAVALLLSRLGPIDVERAPFIATVSGGGAGLTGDIAVRSGLPLAQLTEGTVSTLRGLLPPGAYLGNPLDVSTGDADAAYAAVAADPNVGLLVEPWVLPWPDESDDYRWQRDAIERVVHTGRAAGVPVVVASLFEQPLTKWATDCMAEHDGVVLSPDMSATLSALARVYGGRPSRRAMRRRPGTGAAADARVGRGTLIGEAEGRRILERIGIPVVAGVECATADEVVEAASSMREPFALKLSMSTVGHRAEVGGVRLGLAGEAALRQGCSEIARSARSAGVVGEEPIAYLLEQMVFGPELLVGAIRDTLVGPTLTLAVGGWAAEAGTTFGTLVLNGSGRGLGQAVEEWDLVPLLGEARVTHLLALLAQLAAEFVDGALLQYSTVELNPVILTEYGATIVDVLMVAEPVASAPPGRDPSGIAVVDGHR